MKFCIVKLVNVFPGIFLMSIIMYLICCYKCNIIGIDEIVFYFKLIFKVISV